MRNLYSRASIYAATARYEPFGIAPLEAAFSRCAIVANDIPSYREIWGESAIYFRTNCADSLAETMRELLHALAHDGEELHSTLVGHLDSDGKPSKVPQALLQRLRETLRELLDRIDADRPPKKKRTKAETEAFLARWDENNRRLLELAQKAQAELDRRKSTAN